MQHHVIEMLESQRRELNTLRNRLGSLQDYLDRGRPSSEEEARTRARMREQKRLLEERERLFSKHLQILRRTDPDTVRAWVEQHLAALDEIINAPPPPDFSRSETMQSTRLFVAENTADAWQEVLEGTRDYVHVNRYFLPDYESHLKNLA